MTDAAREDLALIRRFMEETRRDVVDNGKHFAIWGVVSTLGLLVTWWAVLGRTAVNPTVVWGVLLGVGWLASAYVGWRDGRGSQVATLGRRLLSAIWVTTAVTLTLLGVAGMLGTGEVQRMLAGTLSVVIAVPIWMTALLTGEGWLRWVAVAWWAAGAVMLFAPGLYALPLMATMSLLLMAVPGGVLNARAGHRSSPVPLSVGA